MTLLDETKRFVVFGGGAQRLGGWSDHLATFRSYELAEDIAERFAAEKTKEGSASWYHIYDIERREIILKATYDENGKHL